ncbi:MAG: Carboxypeptidase regulatory-like domain [Verrucomicrobiota bacterium]|jgi:hypothetical protein
MPRIKVNLQRTSTLLAVSMATVVLASVHGRPARLLRRRNSQRAVSEMLQSLELAPTGEAGTVRALRGGSPIPGALVTVKGPDSRKRQVVADDQGCIRFDNSRPGEYLVTIRKSDEAAMSSRYRASMTALDNDVSTLLWIQPEPGNEYVI